MHLKFRNVNEAFDFILKGVTDGSIPTIDSGSRNGDVVQIPEVLTITYLRPWERVLFNSGRDCNPFFHLYEAMWMLAGREDVASLEYFNSQMAQYSDDGKVFNGAYGNRWRNWKVPRWTQGHNMSDPDLLYWEGIDQLEVIAKNLTRDNNSRREVLEMWSVHSDLLRNRSSKDVCCNLVVTFQIVDAFGAKKLDMSVFNRSNDTIWGLLGANVVHFSFLHEWMASMCGVKMGLYNQISVNAHFYADKFTPEKWIGDTTPDLYLDALPINLTPLIEDKNQWERDVLTFCENPYNSDNPELPFTRSLSKKLLYDEPFFTKVAIPACKAFHAHKNRKYEDAFRFASTIESTDWQFVCTEWLMKRERWYKERIRKSGNPYAKLSQQDQ